MRPLRVVTEGSGALVPQARGIRRYTFAGAISKTAAGGEIDVLDTGSFGGVTITKSISIVNRGAIGGVSVSSITVDTAATDAVVLQGLALQGVAGTGTFGIVFNTAGALYVEDCTVNGYADQGIAFTPTGAGKLFIEKTIVRNNAGYGILIKPSGGVPRLRRSILLTSKTT